MDLTGLYRRRYCQLNSIVTYARINHNPLPLIVILRSPLHHCPYPLLSVEYWEIILRTFLRLVTVFLLLLLVTLPILIFR
jgi:hypothetical protein